jgi:hypothetical protein
VRRDDPAVSQEMAQGILSRARAELDRVRADPRVVLDVDLTGDGAGGEADRNEVRRALVLWALQYDRRPDDLPLLRRLVEQEAQWRGAAGGGLGEVAELAGFLLAGHRRVEDVWRHWALKGANFDAACAYDGQYLVVAGVPETIAHVRASDRAERDALLGYLRSTFAPDGGDQEDLPGWWEGKREWFPADPAAEEPAVWRERAELLGGA